jgi:hypothetical protein
VLPSSYPGRLASRNSAESLPFLPIHFRCHLKRLPQFCLCWPWILVIEPRGGPDRKQRFPTIPLLLQRPLHRNGSFSIVACVFISTGTCLPSRCLAMNVYTGSAIPPFRYNVTKYPCSSRMELRSSVPCPFTPLTELSPIISK